MATYTLVPNATASPDAGDWIVSELKPSSSINNIKSFKLKFEVKSDGDLRTVGVPGGFMINDITIVYRQKNVK